MNVITKVILLIVLIVTPIIGLFAYTNQQSVHVIEDQINTRNEEKLSYFLNEIERLLDQNMMYATLATKDPEIRDVSFGNLPPSGYDRQNVIQSIQSKLRLFSITNQVMNVISVYFPKSDLSLSTMSSAIFGQAEVQNQFTANWKLNKVDVNGVQMEAFSRYFFSPYQVDPHNLMNADLIIRVDFFTQNITNLLDGFTLAGHSDAFFYHSPDQVVYSSKANTELIQQVMKLYPLDQYTSKTKSYDIVKIDGKKYLLYTLASSKMDWSLVDIEPLDQILQPVVVSRNLFYVILLLLLLFGIVSALLLYSHIHVPIRILIRGVEHIKNKNFAYQIKSRRKNEFQQLFDSFNGMAVEIDQLLKRVYTEEVRSREAVMKQLQSQINPHFLYNCLAYIVNMAKMNKNQSVIAMAHNLGDYYKYTTRNESLVTTLRMEIDLAISYLDIMNSQLDKLAYTITIPENMLDFQIPKLLIQPIIENAIVHGLEDKLEDGVIAITGMADQVCRLVIEDNGSGLTSDALQMLRKTTGQEVNISERTGLWNVNHRLKYYFGEHSGIQIDHSALGGLRIELYWEIVEKEGAA
ncbi:two-component system sensor histidine kinase YesM [Paenibacillus endophyticus]|uniref:Two-component system sensor histidine kinase YesM n=1 Tax=Paenibacillus endophyticus TaxID=1294268 RepID=A0A7W5G9P3_9BACL|nr:histidine kinase [Paenibacillus endophyticus]MBB3151871.1 two-component system sensor histidine kinase YesM [Paenibacillus endophyticus]